jgi:predicted permease
VAAGCVLLVACANLANLMLARGLRDRGQTAVRVALGAPWTRLVRKALVECVALSTIGGVLGIAVAYAGTRLILYLAFHFGGPDHFIPVSAAPSWPVLAFALAVSIATGLLFGIAPSWVAAHADPVEALRGANRSVGGGRGWTQRSLVIGQAALSLVLLSAAALLARSLHNLEHQDFGFETGGRYVAVVNPTLGATKPEQMPMLFRRIVEQMRQVPGVRMASAALYAPMTGDSWNDAIRIQGQPEPGPKDDVGAGWARVTPGFFETLGSRTLLGRTFTDQDTRATRPVAVVNQAFVRRFLKGKSPIGAHFGPGKIAYASRYEIIGVVRDIRYMTYDYNQPVRPMYWLPEDQSVTWDDPMFTGGEIWSHSLYNLVLWAPGNPPGLAQNVRRALASVAPDIAMESLDSYDAILGADFQQQNMIATLTMLFGGLGLLLAAVGLYGVLSYSVEQRTSEIGLRMALGADRGQVVRLVMRGALLQVGVGLAIGIPAAVAAGRLMSGQLFGVRAWDPLMLAAASAVLLAAGLVAALLPARRAAAVDPMVALRSQ